MSGERPDVTVVMPTYQRWAGLGRSLRCALEQRDVELEVVIVSDGEQRMPEDMLPPEEDRVRVIYPPVRKGVGHARNLGVEDARAEWVAFLDDDDLWAPDKLSRQLAALEVSGADWTYASALSVDEQLRPVEYFPAPPTEAVEGELMIYNAIPAGCSNVVARASTIRAAGGFDPSFHQLADWDMWIRLADAGRGVAIDDVLVGYVQHSGSMLLTDEGSAFDEFNRLAAKVRGQGRKLSHEHSAFWTVSKLEDAGMRGRAIRASLYGALRYRDPGLLVNAVRMMLGRPRADDRLRSLPESAPGWMAEVASY